MEKKDRIRVIFPDYLDGSREVPSRYIRDISILLGKDVYKNFDSIIREEGFLTTPNEITETIKHLEKEFPMSSVGSVARCYIRTLHHYYDTPPDERNYILSKPLGTAFNQGRMDVKCSTLPKKFAGYIDQGGCEVVHYTSHHATISAKQIGTFISIEFNRITAISLIRVPEGTLMYHHSYDIDETKTISEVVRTHPHKNTLGTGATTTAEILNSILSAVLYITHAPNDLMKYLYEFPRSEKKAARLKPHYTEKPVTIVGKFFTLPKTYTDDWIQNKGYFGWRWTGVGRSILKYVWVRPSKPYKKGV